MFTSIIRNCCHGSWLTRANINRAVKGARSESGSVESTLVLIPLLILFLITMQIGVAINFRNIDRTFAQSAASERAISGNYSTSDQVIEIDSLGPFNPLGVLISKRISNIPILLPYVGSWINRAHRTEITGIALLENLT